LALKSTLCVHAERVQQTIEGYGTILQTRIELNIRTRAMRGDVAWTVTELLREGAAEIRGRVVACR
jgi:hypothetical protein